jgi:hypothetical protein
MDHALTSNNCPPRCLSPAAGQSSSWFILRSRDMLFMSGVTRKTAEANLVPKVRVTRVVHPPLPLRCIMW